MDTNQLHAELSSRMEQERDRLVGLLRRLIQRKSESQNPNNRNLRQETLDNLALIKQWLDPYGFVSEQWDVANEMHGPLPVMVSRRPGSGSGRSLAFNGHVDVVPAGERAKWLVDPYQGEIVDGELYGRGASDMKGGVAATLMAVALLIDAGYDLLGDVEFHTVSDEEIVGIGTREIVKRIDRLDAVIGTEPTGMTVCPVAPGLEHLRIEIHGKSSHAGMRYAEIYDGYESTSANAIEKGLKIIAAMHKLERQWGQTKSHPLFPQGYNTLLPGFVVGGMGGGSNGMVNEIANPGTTPDYCSIEYNIWYYPGEHLTGIQQEIEACIRKVCEEDDWLKLHPPVLTWALRGISFPAMDTAPSHELVDLLANHVQSAGYAREVVAFEAAADLSWYSIRGIPAVLHGPGKIHHAHAANERVIVDDLCASAVALATTMASWCGVRKRE